MIKLWVDFNASTVNGGVRLTCKGTIDDLARQKIELQEGLRLLLWNEDFYENDLSSDTLIVEAVAHFNDNHKIWEAIFNMEDIEHKSDFKK